MVMLQMKRCISATVYILMCLIWDYLCGVTFNGKMPGSKVLSDVYKVGFSRRLILYFMILVKCETVYNNVEKYFTLYGARAVYVYILWRIKYNKQK